jgi:hypothetical protein
MIDHHVHDQPKPFIVQFSDQLVEIGHSSIHGIDVAEIADIIPIVPARRSVHGIDPKGSDTKRDDMIQPVQYPTEIAIAIAVAILEAPGKDLIDNGFFPPSMCGLID